MKVLGHSWVAVKVFPTGQREKLVWGAILPEMMFYVKDNPFGYEEIHEGGDMILSYAKTAALAWIDLGRGMITHSVRYGADYFNKLDWLRLLGYHQNNDQEFDKQVADALGVDMQTAKLRVHNILDLALEIYLAQKHPEIKEWLGEAFERVGIEEVAGVLVEAFNKPETLGQVKQAIAELEEKISPKTLIDIYGIARMWCRFSESLPEQNVDLEKVVEVLGSACKKIRGKERAFLNLVINRTRANLQNSLF